MVGCGHMGSAMLTGWLAAGIDPAHVTVIRPSGAPARPSIRVLADYPQDEVPAIVVLAMKPHQLDAVAPLLAPALDPRTILVSILAGVEAASLRERFAAPEMIVKAMPNLPVALGKGVVGLYAVGGRTADRNLVSGLMAALGHAEWFQDEAAFQLAGILSGAGPAFLFRFIDALSQSATALGLAEDQARRLATAMVAGAGALAASSQDSAAELARKVASPNGTTEAGLKVLDADRALLALLEATLSAAQARSLEMAAEARTG
jgi:pyrroline-5-carboxylate reductase